MSNHVPWVEVLTVALDGEFAARPRIAVLATVDADGRPRARNVVVRQVENDGMLHLLSDARSQKNAHLRQTPYAELVFWLPTRREQFRLAGPAAITTQKDNSIKLHQFWTSLPDLSRALFLWPAPGQPRAPDSAFSPPLPVTAPVPATFELITLMPDEVDYLQLTPAPHLRHRYRADNAWRRQDVNP